MESNSSSRKKSKEQSVFSPGPFLSGYDKEQSRSKPAPHPDELPLPKRILRLLDERCEPMTMLEMTSELRTDAGELRPALLKLVDAGAVVIDSVRSRELFSLA